MLYKKRDQNLRRCYPSSRGKNPSNPGWPEEGQLLVSASVPEVLLRLLLLGQPLTYWAALDRRMGPDVPNLLVHRREILLDNHPQLRPLTSLP